MGFINLPNEVILLLIPHLEYENEINALCCTTRWLHELLNPILYKHSTTQRDGGYTLEWAAIHGSVSTGRLILEAGAPPDACGEHLWQPFALAALHGHSEIIALLYEQGLDPCSTDNDWKNHLDDDKEENQLSFWIEGHPLSMAASSGHVSVVNLLLHYGVPPDLSTGDHGKQTALHLAAQEGHLDVCRVLADAGSLINAQDEDSATPLALAAGRSHLDIVQFLLARGADPNITTKHTGTSLCIASCSGNIDIVRCLLDHGATPDPSYPDGQKPLFQLSRAAERRYDKIIDLLLTRFDYVQSSTEPYQQAILLRVAILTGRTTLLTELLTKHNYDPNLRITDETILVPYPSDYTAPKIAIAWAAERNQPAAIDILISHGASINPPTNVSPNTDKNEDNPLLWAIQKGRKEATATLLAHGANPNNPPGQALYDAVFHPSIFSLLLSYNADPTMSIPESSLLARVLLSGEVDTLRILFDHPKGTELVVDPIWTRSIGRSRWIPLFHVALLGGDGVLRLLFDRGLLSPPKELHDQTAAKYLALAVEHGGPSLVRLLLDMGFDLRVDNNAGDLVYWSAIAEEDPEGFLDFILQNGCSIDDTDRMGRTALFQAASEGDEDVIKRLLERGANPLIVCWGETALSIAAKDKNVGAVRLILGAFNDRGLNLSEVDGILKRAEKHALGRADIVRALRRYRHYIIEDSNVRIDLRPL